ncbi:MAG TPA: DUF4430 domain-containing protein [Rummeliibacillus sp.]|nr:DUF4430 domain-containing protein [Rummeliibacillus sp.]
MKKVHFYILSLIIAVLCLAGCKIQTVEQYNNQNADEKSVDQSNGKVVPVNEENQDQQPKKKSDNSGKQTEKNQNTKDSAKRSDESKQIDKKSENQTSGNEKKETKTSQKETIAFKKDANQAIKETNQSEKETKSTNRETKQVTKEKVASKNNASNKSNSTSKATDKKIVKEKKKYVTISVRVDTLLKDENYEKLEKPLQSEKYVPKNGGIIATSKYEILSDNDTAWSITLRALKEHNVQFEYEGAGVNKYGMVYIQGINHLYEKNAGPLSGWMYSVNGKNPGVGCDGYKVKDGDQIDWQYTVDQGKDIGL